MLKGLEMLRHLHRSALLIALAVALGGCSVIPKSVDGRWIHLDPVTQRYSVDAQQVPRGELLDELKAVAGAEVRPQPDPKGLVTAKAKGLDLEGLIALILPTGTRPTIRPGDREVAAVLPTTEPRKEGPTVRPTAGVVAKPALEVEPELKRVGTLKASSATPLVQSDGSGPRAKAQSATLLRVAETSGPKSALPARAEGATVRLTLQFEDGVAPRLINAQLIEGRAPAQRFVTGTYLYAVFGANGKLLEAGTFQDPLVEHSYLPDGQHSAGRARTGVVGISIARENLGNARLQIVDMTGVPLPRELNEEVVRAALNRGKTTMQIDTQGILQRTDQEPRK